MLNIDVMTNGGDCLFFLGFFCPADGESRSVC